MDGLVSCIIGMFGALWPILQLLYSNSEVLQLSSGKNKREKTMVSKPLAVHTDPLSKGKKYFES